MKPLSSKSRGQLKNGNQGCDLQALPRCQATAKHSGKRCGRAAMKGKKVCQFHGGKSTGPKTQAGKEASRLANYRTGYYTKTEKERRRKLVDLNNTVARALNEAGPG